MKLVSLLSSGIDSPVATYLLFDKVQKILLVHADNRPFTDDQEIKNFLAIAKHLNTTYPRKLSAILVPHGTTLTQFKQTCNNKFTCVFCKRMMLRYAERIAEQKGASAIVMGDSLGQVASQTLQNIRVIEQAVRLPVLRPLIGLDKEDIVHIAKKIGTYDRSILPAAACSAVPRKPSTKATLSQIMAEEQKLLIEDLVTRAVSQAEHVEL